MAAKTEAPTEWSEPDLTMGDHGRRTFKEAFLEGRRRKVKAFRWQGRRYHTGTTEDEKAPGAS